MREACAGTDILDRFAEDLARSGVAGESKLAKLLYLAVTSRFLKRPVSVALKGPRRRQELPDRAGSEVLPRGAPTTPSQP